MIHDAILVAALAERMIKQCEFCRSAKQPSPRGVAIVIVCTDACTLGGLQRHVIISFIKPKKPRQRRGNDEFVELFQLISISDSAPQRSTGCSDRQARTAWDWDKAAARRTEGEVSKVSGHEMMAVGHAIPCGTVRKQTIGAGRRYSSEHQRTYSTQHRGLSLVLRLLWLGGRVVAMLDFAGSNPSLSAVECNRGQVVNTHMCLCHQAV